MVRLSIKHIITAIIDMFYRHDLTIPQREEYIRAVLCLQSMPPKADQKKYPGLMTRYDDFVLTHETQAMHLHSTVRCFIYISYDSIADKM